MHYKISAILVAGLISSTAIAQTQPAKPVTKEAPKPAAKPAPKAVAKTAAAQPPRTAKSLECSKQADGKKLHGKERKSFMSKCKKD